MASVDTIPRLLHDDPAPPADLAVTALGRDDRPVRGLSRGMVLQEAERLAGRLHADGLAGRTVLIPERNGLEYVVAFLACLRMGAIAVTAHQPRPGGGGDRLAAIAPIIAEVVSNVGEARVKTALPVLREMRVKLSEFGKQD